MNDNMRRGDEEVLEMTRHANQETKKMKIEEELEYEKVVQAIGEGRLTFDDQTIEFKELSFFDEQLLVKIPSDFEKMPEEIARLKYPMENRPEFIYANIDSTVSFTLKKTENNINQEDLEEFTYSMMNLYKKMQPSAEIGKVEVKEINEVPIGYFDFISPVLDGKIYNLIAAFKLNDKVIFTSFNCLERDMEIWKNIIHGLIENIKIRAMETSD